MDHYSVVLVALILRQSGWDGIINFIASGMNLDKKY